MTATPGSGDPAAITRALAADDGGAATPPPTNRELVFAEPWESRAFAVALALCERGTLEWGRFRQGLIAEISDWEVSQADGDPGWSYYRRWLASLERLLAAEGLVSEEEIARREAELEHADDHDHDHPHQRDDHGHHQHGGDDHHGPDGHGSGRGG